MLLFTVNSYAKSKKSKKSKIIQNKTSKSDVKSNQELKGWLDLWPDGSMTSAKSTLSHNKLTVKGISFDRSYGSVYKKITPNLDKTPYLILETDSVDGFWYVLAKNANIRGGYVKVQPDTNVIGKHLYDFKSITGLSGKPEVEIEIGISSGKDEPNQDKTVVFNDFKFASADPEIIPGALSLGPWKEKWPDGTPTGANAKNDSSGLHIKGTSKSKSYGTAYRIVSIDLNEKPYLELAPTKVDGSWYIEASGGPLKQPVKIQKDTDSLKPHSYNLKEKLGIGGKQSFELHIGIGSGGKEKNAGKEVTFKNNLRFVSKIGGE